MTKERDIESTIKDCWTKEERSKIVFLKIHVEANARREWKKREIPALGGMLRPAITVTVIMLSLLGHELIPCTLCSFYRSHLFSTFFYSGTEKSPSIFYWGYGHEKIKLIFQFYLQQGISWDWVLANGIWTCVLHLTWVTVTKYLTQAIYEIRHRYFWLTVLGVQVQDCIISFVSVPSEGCT